jgi:hypothetical protein
MSQGEELTYRCGTGLAQSLEQPLDQGDLAVKLRVALLGLMRKAYDRVSLR